VDSSSSRTVISIAFLAVLAHVAGASAKVQLTTVRPLVARLVSSDASGRMTAERALLEMGPDAVFPLLEILAQGNLAEVEPIRELLPKYGPAAIQALAEAGSRDYGGMNRRVMWNAAAEAVVRMGEPAVPVIIEGFKNPGPLFSFSTQVLARMQEQGGGATQLLIPLLDSPQEDVRRRAAAILGNHPDPRAFDALLAALHSEDSTVRTYAARGLGYLGDPRATDALLAMVGDPTFAREAAIGALGRMYEPSFRTMLARVARGDKEVSVRDAAANWLLRSGDPLAMRLGRRYMPIALSPARQVAIELRYAVMLSVTFLAVLGIAFWALLYRRGPEGPRRAIVALAACALGLGGVLWGGSITNVTAIVEHLLLLLVVPLAGAAVYLFGPPAKLERFRLPFITSVSAFYLGYGAGWLWLWGYLGF